MSDVSERYDAVVVGGGPAGIFAAYSLAVRARRVLLLEAGGPMLQSLCPRVKVDLEGRLVRASERFRMQCPRCTCLTGLGGAAFHFDTNLGYSGNLSRSKIERSEDGQVRTFSSLERVLSPYQRAQTAVRDVFGILHRHGLPEAPPEPPRLADTSPLDHQFVGADLTTSQSITVDTALSVVESLMASFVAAGGEVRFMTRATEVDRGGPTRFTIGVEDASGAAGEVAADTVVVAVGKLGLPWVRSTIARLGLDHQPSHKVDVGVRLEGSRERLAPLCSRCANPKLAYLNDRGQSVRTFCVCAGGRIMQYAFGDAVVLDGQHCLTRPTSRSNFGIVTTLDVPAGLDGTDFALDLARTVTRAGEGRPVACSVGELRGRTAARAAPTGTLATSLVEFTHAPLTGCFPPNLVEDILGMVDRLNTVFPRMVDDSDVVAAPVIERIYPQLSLSGNLESSEPGLYFVGDASSRIIGVTYGAATGLAAAAHILGRT
jgi:uncharacterized protein